MCVSAQDFLTFLSQHNAIVIGYFIFLPLCSFLLSLGYQSTARRGFREYLFSGLTYLSFVPGIFAGMLVFYTLLILRKNLLEVNFVLYFLPLISMGAVYWLLGRAVDFDQLPGFGRLAGLMVMLSLVCFVIFFLYQLRFVIAFFGSMEFLAGAAIAIFMLFKWSAGKIKGKH